MTSRQRNSSSSSPASSPASQSEQPIGSRRLPREGRRAKQSRHTRRRHLLETLEARQLLAGPELIGIQPNEGELIDNGDVRQIAPRVLTFRFDEDQQLDANTLGAIQISRSGRDGAFGTADDVPITPGLVTLGDPNENEIVVRFADSLPDDNYRINIFGYDDPTSSPRIVGLRNVQGELIQPSVAGERVERIDFRLDLGALIEAVVPQPVVRNADGSLTQNRNEVVVYFNEDPLFFEDEAAEAIISREAATLNNGTTLGAVTLRVNAQLTGQVYESTEIVFNRITTAGLSTTASFNEATRTITVNHPSTATFSNIATAVNALPDFSAVAEGAGTRTFGTGSSLPVRAEIVGIPSQRSAENPRFYQLLLTQETVRTTDDVFYQPREVIYNAETHTARLIFDTDINNLPGVPVGGGTFRLRIGTAVDSRVDLIVKPDTFNAAPSATVSLGAAGGSFQFVSEQVGESASGQEVRFVNTGIGGLSVSRDGNGAIVFDFGGVVPLVSDLGAAIASNPVVRNLISIDVDSDSATTPVPERLVGAAAVVLLGLGDTLGSSLDVGMFGQSDALTSLVIRESISPQQVNIELPGGDGDPGHRLLIKHINETFGADTQSGVSEIPYNFQGVYFTNGNESSLNQITPTQKLRIREVLELWSQKIGVQFAETANQGITFAVGETSTVLTNEFLPDDQRFTAIPQLQASVRVDPAINDNATAASANASIVFSNQANFGLNYGEDFTRKSAAGIGFLLGLLAAPDQAQNVLMALSAFNQDALLRRPSDPEGPIPGIPAPTTNPNSPDYQRFDEDYPEFRGFLNDLIDPISLPDAVPTTEGSLVYLPDNLDDFQLPGWEPVFPSNVDVLHGQYVHRPDSVDVDLYRFEVNLNDADRVGQLSVETFAERLADSSGLDTTLTLFEEVRASAITDLRVGPTLQLRFDAVQVGTSGNGARIEFVESDRTLGDDVVRVLRVDDGNGNVINNVITIDMPRRGRFVDSVSVADLIGAIESDAFASSLFSITLVKGSPTTDISGRSLRSTPIVLSGGELQQLSRNDDYFSEDSFLTAALDAGVYYIGVAASGNDTYDPMIRDSGFGGLTQGEYELRIKFEPQVDEVDVIRDVDGTRPGIPGTPIDGDGDGVPRGVHNFWFQTRPELRTMQFTLDGEAITPRQSVRVVGSDGDSRTYEFIPFNGGAPRPGNIVIRYSNTPGNDSPAGNLAELLATAINGRQDATGVRASVSGDNLTLDGERSLSFSSGFRGIETFGRMIFVDKAAATNADGSLELPFNNINNPAVVNAFGSALRGDIVRIVGNGGADQNIVTEADNFAYEFGLSEVGGRVLEDGRDMEIPAGVTTMIDAGAIFKLRSSRISVGSSGTQIDRSGGALQVLGTPRLVSFDGQDASIVGEFNDLGTGYDDGSVIFTSTRDRAADAPGAGTSPAPRPGDWGGLVFRRDVDQAQGRRDLEDEGIFLQTVNHAEIRFGGSSNILIDSVQQLVNPIQMINLRPNITFNEITRSADAAMSAAPDSFQETTFGTPAFQQAGEFTSDYSRIGPDIHNNRLVNNSLNGLFIRTIVTPTSPPTQLTVSARFDDTSVVHFIAENLVIAGSPGGSITDGVRPSLAQASAQVLTGGVLPVNTTRVEYLMTFVDANGFESAATGLADSLELIAATGQTLGGASIELAGLPRIPINTDYISRRLYRAEFDSAGNLIPFDVDDQGNPVSGHRLIADLDGSGAIFTDDGSATEGVLDLTRVGRRGRLDASLTVDPGMVVKLQGAHIQLGQGTQLLSEGTLSQPVIFTSSLDDRYGAGGTFDTNNDAGTITGNRAPTRGNWSGIYASPNAYVSLDHAVVSYGGGISLVAGGETRGFAPLELQQADGRVTNSRFEFNEDGQDGSGRPGRGGLLAVEPSVIFVRGSQPVIVGNDFVDNRGAAIGIDVDSLTADLLRDTGRQTGGVDTFSDLDDNHGPLIRQNRFEIVAADDDGDKQISGLVIRGGALLVESVWDDTDIVHVLNESVTVGNIQSSGGLLLQSRANESLVIKMSGAGTPNSPTLGTGFTATGESSDSAERLGGTVHIVGLPGAPVVLTSFKDDTVGAGLSVDGTQFTDTNGDSFGSRPASNDWRSVLLDQYSNDRNVDFVLEQELATDVAPGRNGTVAQAQFLGELASDLNQGDENRRLGFEVKGYLSEPTDIDTYSFVGSAGSEIWVDVDHTAFGLDTVIELLNAEGVLLARSDNSLDGSLTVIDPSANGLVGPLQSRDDSYTELNVFGDYRDLGSVNPRDAGFRITLPGNSTTNNNRSEFFFRIRSASSNPNDPEAGGSRGNYSFQVRLQEAQEYPGSVVRFADIRFANHGIHVRGLPGESPLLGEAGENERIDSNGNVIASNDVLENIVLGNDNRAPQNRPQYIGNLLEGKNPVISVAGSLSSRTDVDIFQIDLDASVSTEGFVRNYLSTIFDIDYASGLTRPDTNISVFYDPDGEFGPAQPQLVLFGADSNVAEDQASPFGEGNDLSERLNRGSISTSDPMIGPVSLPEGSYYVAVTTGDRLPDELFNVDTRREPINSVQRLFEDRIDVFIPEGETQNDSVFGGPRFDELFNEIEIVGSGFQTSTDRGGELGHGIYGNFDNTNVAQVGSTQTLYSEFQPSSPLGSGVYTSIQSIPEAPRLPFGALDLSALDWSLNNNPQIGGGLNFQTPGFGFDYTAATIPHVTVEGGMGGDIADFYQLVVPNNGTRVIIDIDEGFNPFQGTGDDFIPDFDSVDVDLVILDAATNVLLPGRITTSDPDEGELGSLGSTFIFGAGDVFGRSRDPLFDGFLDAGVYFIGVLEQLTDIGRTDTGALTVSRGDDEPTPISGRYLMHVSAENQPVNAGLGTNESLFLDRNFESNGELRSNPFDLTGYVAADLPRFYFNYRWDSPQDGVRLNVTSNENPTGISLTSTANSPFALTNQFADEIVTLAAQNDFVSDGQWRQQIVDLGSFAGHTGIRFEFEYEGDSVPLPSVDGLFLDDFIVGFAERGETVFNAVPGETGFRASGSGSGPAGEYQLEARRATNFATSLGVTQALTASFDTNDRHTQEVTLIVPAGSQIADGDTFVLSDGQSTQVFEFDSNNVAGFGNQHLPFLATDTPRQLAMKMRAAINAASRLNVEAASASGLDDELMTGNRLNLFGVVSGSFETLTTFTEAPAVTDPLGFEFTDSNERRVLLPAVLHNGVGDVNYQRTQSQILIENNVISDVHAIGIWSDPGDRGFDPEDQRANPANFANFNDIFGLDRTIEDPHPFLQQPPIGNPAAGIARNLPTLNNSVEGGLMTGIVVRNNTIDQAGLSGVKIQGETRPFVITTDVLFGTSGLFTDVLSEVSDIPDGLSMAIDSGGTRVVFEFEDVGGAPVGLGGSGVTGGNGWTDGHVPIFYRHVDTIGTYNNQPVRSTGYSSFELMLSIQQSIQGSILVTNDMAELVTATLGPSPTQRNGFFEQFARNAESFPTAAVYLEGVSNIYFTPAYGGGFVSTTDDETRTATLVVNEAAIAEAPQPFARVINNTVYGADGTESLFPDDASADRNDVLADATVTHLGKNHAGPYIQNAVIGYNIAEGLTGQTMSFQALFNGASLTDLRTAVVGVGTEFPNINTFATDGAPTDAINANIGVNNSAIVVNYTEEGVVEDGVFNGYVFEGDFSDLMRVDVSPASTVGVDISFTDTRLLVNLTSGQTIDSTDQLFLNLVFPQNVLPAALAGVADANDLDLYRVELVVGDRLIVDIDTEAGGPDTIIQIFDEFGERQVLNFGSPNETRVADNGSAPPHLDPRSTAFADGASARPGNVFDPLNGRDPFVDFTTLRTGTYFIGVSASGNVNYDPNSLSGRTGGNSTGEYEIGIEVYAPRQFVMSIDNENEGQGRQVGTKAGDLIGQTFTITQIPDFAGNWPNFPVSGGTPQTEGNRLTFEFTSSTLGIILPNGNYNIPLFTGVPDGGYRVPEIMDAIASAITGLQDELSGDDVPAMPNYENGNGPNGRSGPITRVTAKALGGATGDNAGIVNLSDPSRRPGITRTVPPLHFTDQSDSDFPLGFGHDRVENLNQTIAAGNALTDGFASTELYVLFNNAAKIELSPGAIDAGLKLTTNDYRRPNNNRVDFAENSDQLILESGIWVTGGASPTLMNNVLSNLHQSIVIDETNFFGFGKRVKVAGDDFVKPQNPVLIGNVFQHDETRNSEIRFDLTWPIDPTPPFDVVDTSFSTDDVVGATNVTVQSGDFNFFIDPSESLLVDAQGNNFLPAPGSRVIDSAISSLIERSAFSTVKSAVGLPSSNILSPNRDVNGILRADNPDFATPGSIGQTLFKDRGSSELADFTGPIAIAVNPRDNDAAGLDGDETTSVIQRGVGMLNEFRIQLVDTGDASNPFTGIGVDDSTVKVAAIDGLRRTGANVTLFENDRLLTEGIDYTFSFDETSNTITLTPLAGVWRDDRSYRIALNNRDRSVLIAPDPSEVADGDQIRITDSDGGTVVFEFESGYQLYLPEAMTLVVPEIGTDAGGIRDGDIFQVADGVNSPVVFEFDADGVLLPGSRRIALPTESLVSQNVGLRVGSDNFLFQFVSEGGVPSGGAIPVTFNPFDPIEGSIFELCRVINQTLANNGINAFVSVPEDDLTTLLITQNTGGPTISITSRPASFTTGPAPSPALGVSLRLQSLPTIPMPTDRVGREAFVARIAQSIQTAITKELRKDGEIGDLPPRRVAAFDFEVVVDGNRVVLGAPDGFVSDTSGSGLGQDARTLAFQVPIIGTGVNGIADGDSFTVSNGNVERSFEFTFDAQLNSRDATAIFIDVAQGNLSGEEVAELVREAVADGGLGLTPTVEGETVYLNLPSTGMVTTSAGQLRVVGVSRPIEDGNLIRLSRTPEPASTAIEINNGFPAGFEVGTIVAPLDGVVITLELREGDLLPQLFNFEFDISDENPPEVAAGNTAIDITETIVDELGIEREFFVTRDELARRLANAIRVRGINVDPVPQDEFVYLTVPSGQTARIVTEFNGVSLTQVATFEQRQTLEFDLETEASPVGDGAIPGNVRIPYSLTDTASQLADKVSAALNLLAAAEDADGNALIPGLLPGSNRVAPGQIAINVDVNDPLTLSVSDLSSLEVRGEPGVSGSSTVQVFGPLLLSMPILGGNSIFNGGVFVITDPEGNDVVFQFAIGGVVPVGRVVPGANVIAYSTANTAEALAVNFAASINASTAGLNAAVVNNTQISLGRTDRDRVSNTGLPGINGTPAIDIIRGIVNDGEILRIRQGDVSVSFEFDSVDSGGGVQPGNIQVSFQPTSTPGDIAESLAAAIRNNSGGLRFTPGEDGVVHPIAELDENGIPTGGVILNDLPGTQVDISAAPTLNVVGVPGGAIPIAISPLFGAEAVKQVLLRQLNSVNRIGEDPTTTLTAEDRGGNTVFVENASIISGPVENYFLPAIKDLVGNNLEPNRDDRSTQFTINLADIRLDFGDAPDPVEFVPGRYPTRLIDNGARHVIGSGPTLGRTVDAELDALSVRTADGDDLTIVVSGGGGLFAPTLVDGEVEIAINPSNVFDVTRFDGETFTIDTGISIATFEFDINGIFDEDHFAVWVPGYTGGRVLTVADRGLLTPAAIAQGIEDAIELSPLNPASVSVVTGATANDVSVIVSGDDEDGVTFVSGSNPQGVFNASLITQVGVTVNGAGVLEAWIDFNADGDWDDPGELVISPNLPFLEGLPNPAIFGAGESVRNFDITIPQTTARLAAGESANTYARFRISRNGTGSPVGLALSGEVEDYLVRLVGGQPPVIGNASPQYTVREGEFLQATDDIGEDAFVNNNGLLVGVTTGTPGGVEIFSEDIGIRELLSESGQFAGTLEIQRNGTFTFDADGDFSGPITFSVLATDVVPGSPENQLVSTRAIVATITVTPVNDAPTLQNGIVASDVIFTATINEDNVVSQTNQTSLGAVVFDAADLIDPFYIAGPGNEPAEQSLFFRRAGTETTAFRTTQGGSLTIVDNGRRILYTPPQDFNGQTPDTFFYTVADQLLSTLPGSIVSQSAVVQGRVEIVINAINDQPRLNSETYQTEERTSANSPTLTIPIFGPQVMNGQTIAGLLDNDSAGPLDERESPQNQTISLLPNQFTAIENGVIVQSRRTEGGGGRIAQVGDNLIYTARPNYSGIDRFTYIVRDSLGAESTATATIVVGNVNNPPEFFGVRGQESLTTLGFEERKQIDEVATFDLASWFTDADNDRLTFPQPDVGNPSLIQATTVGSLLTLNFTPFAFGSTTLTVRAVDPFGLSVSQQITVNVNGTPDPPIVVGSLQPFEILEDSVALADLKRLPGESQGLFLDPDGDNLTYNIRRLGSIINPTAADYAAHPLIQSIRFIGDTLQITPKPDQSGRVQIEIEAFDGTFQNSHSFDFVVIATEDAPRGNVTPAGVAVPDAYGVPVGGSLRIIDPSLGLLRNDFDPDPGSSIRIAPNSLTQPVGGSGTVDLLGRDDGAFSFTTSREDGSRPVAGQTDTFTYRLIDNTGRLSNPIPVTITFNLSNYQNPIDKYDVSADGFVTAIDALRVLNLINARGTQATAFSVSEIETSPPDYFDVNGDGFINTIDVLQVINELNTRDSNGNNGSGEPIANERRLAPAITNVTVAAASIDVAGNIQTAIASTQSYAAVSTTNLGPVNAVLRSESAQRVRASEGVRESSSSLDEILTVGFDLQSGGQSKAERAGDSLAEGVGSSQTFESALFGRTFDSALVDLFSDEFETD